jgi:archaellum component FlaG (FlaF/FlaG flagellin family)
MQSAKTASPKGGRNASGRNVILACLVVGIIALGAVAVYQQSQIAALSKSISQQSSELAHPSTEMAILNFTVTKANATANPMMFLVVRNEGSAPADSGSFLIGVYGQGNLSFSCYSGNQNIFPIYSNESAMLLSPLSCGELGDKVVLTAQVNFLTSHGSVNEGPSANTTISQSHFSRPPRVVIADLGIETYIVPWVA